MVFCWFASWHSFTPVLLARLLHKPAIVVIGGYDTANVPEAGYGSQRGGLRRLVARTVIHSATHLIAFSESAKKEAVANAGADPDKTRVIYQGIPLTAIGSCDKRKPLVLTVGNVWRENLLRKGLLPFVRAAEYLPELTFVLVGKWHDDSIQQLRRVAGPNVELKGYLSDNQLNELYVRASVYVQASLHEGFGMSVAEAMLGGCIPVVTRKGSLPELVGETGVYIDSNDPVSVAKAIRYALNQGSTMRREAQGRIVSHFSLERRRQALITFIDHLLQQSG